MISPLQDPLKKARNVEGVGHYVTGDTEVTITEPAEVPYVLSQASL